MNLSTSIRSPLPNNGFQATSFDTACAGRRVPYPENLRRAGRLTGKSRSPRSTQAAALLASRWMAENA